MAIYLTYKDATNYKQNFAFTYTTAFISFYTGTFLFFQLHDKSYQHSTMSYILSNFIQQSAMSYIRIQACRPKSLARLIENFWNTFGDGLFRTVSLETYANPREGKAGIRKRYIATLYLIHNRLIVHLLGTQYCDKEILDGKMRQFFKKQRNQ